MLFEPSAEHTPGDTGPHNLRGWLYKVSDLVKSDGYGRVPMPVLTRVEFASHAFDRAVPLVPVRARSFENGVPCSHADDNGSPAACCKIDDQLETPVRQNTFLASSMTQYGNPSS